MHASTGEHSVKNTLELERAFSMSGVYHTGVMFSSVSSVSLLVCLSGSLCALSLT